MSYTCANQRKHLTRLTASLPRFHMDLDDRTATHGASPTAGARGEEAIRAGFFSTTQRLCSTGSCAAKVITFYNPQVAPDSSKHILLLIGHLDILSRRRSEDRKVSSRLLRCSAPVQKGVWFRKAPGRSDTGPLPVVAGTLPCCGATRSSCAVCPQELQRHGTPTHSPPPETERGTDITDSNAQLSGVSAR